MASAPLKIAAVVAAVSLVIAAGWYSAGQSAPAAPRFEPLASIQELMVSVVDPAADGLWDAVSSETTAKGLEEKAPRTKEEWQAVRHHAISLLESTSLLVEPGRRVAAPGRELEDTHIAGVLNAAQAQQAINVNPASFRAYAQALRLGAVEALQAVDKQDAAALVAAGGNIDHACEACHLQFWYPNARRPPAPPHQPAT